ncbi:hypothetical protein [Virgisporangium ochraceum]|nr:hypothetical protein [Virgisporangium ochraceum]
MTATKVARETGPATTISKPAEKKAAVDTRRVLVGEAVEAALHTYEQAVANFVQFEHKAAEVTTSERTKAALNLHATFLADLTAVYVRTARAAMR